MRLRIGSAFGVPIYLHWTFFLLPLWIWWSYQQIEDHRSELLTLPMTLIAVGLVFFCVLVHEFGHILMARYFGTGTHDVTLYPIGGIARMERMSEKPHEEILIAIAGPAVNVVIGGVLFAGLAVVYVLDFDVLPPNAPAAITVVLAVAVMNWALVIFNMLPAFPMDGGRALRAVLTLGLGLYQGTRIAVGVGACMALLIGLWGIEQGNFLMPAIAAFVIFAGQQELMGIRRRELQKARASEEPLEVLPVRPSWTHIPAQTVSPSPSPSPSPNLGFPPRISVYTWDNQTGTWRKEPGTVA